MFIVLNEQLDWSRLIKFWELEGAVIRYIFFCTRACFFITTNTNRFYWVLVATDDVTNDQFVRDHQCYL